MDNALSMGLEAIVAMVGAADKSARAVAANADEPVPVSPVPASIPSAEVVKNLALMALLRCFSSDWERLASIVGTRTRWWIADAQKLRAAGLVESKQSGGHLVWRRTAQAMSAGTAKTEGLGAKPASAVACDAPESPLP